MGPQEDEAGHLGDVMTTIETKIAIGTIETAGTNHEGVAAASNGKKSAEMTATEERKD
jgi:hypothetical protein